MNITETKLIEIRDKATFIAGLAVKINPFSGTESENYLISRSGYGDPAILLTAILTKARVCIDPYKWTDRTFRNVHLYLEKHWDEVKSGDVVDVEYILGETEQPKVSEKASL